MHWSLCSVASRLGSRPHDISHNHSHSLPLQCSSFARHESMSRTPTTRRTLALGASATPLDQQVGNPKATDRYFGEDHRPIILFDGVCNLCNGGVNFMLGWDRGGRCRFAALQSPAGRALLQRSGRAPDDISSIVLVEESETFVKSDAILKIAQRLDIPFPALAGLALLVPRAVRDVVYDGVANNRYRFFGESSECRLSDGRFEDRFVAE